jgi:hypothetical protein
MQRCCKCGVVLWILPCQITKCGQFKVSKWSRHKILTFWGAQDFFGPLNGTSDSEGHLRGQKSRGPLKKSRFCARDHFESLNWPHLVIWQGRIHNTKPHLQHSCIGNFMQPVLNSFLRPFLVFGLYTPPPPAQSHIWIVPAVSVCICVCSVLGWGGGVWHIWQRWGGGGAGIPVWGLGGWGWGLLTSRLVVSCE